MQTQISYHNLEQASHAGLETTIAALAARHLDQYLPRFDAGLVELRVNLDKPGDRDFYKVSLQLSVPGTVLPAKEEGFDLGVLLNRAFEHLGRELSHHVSRLKEN